MTGCGMRASPPGLLPGVGYGPVLENLLVVTLMALLMLAYGLPVPRLPMSHTVRALVYC